MGFPARYGINTCPIRHHCCIPRLAHAHNTLVILFSAIGAGNAINFLHIISFIMSIYYYLSTNNSRRFVFSTGKRLLCTCFEKQYYDTSEPRIQTIIGQVLPLTVSICRQQRVSPTGSFESKAFGRKLAVVFTGLWKRAISF